MRYEKRMIDHPKTNQEYFALTLIEYAKLLHVSSTLQNHEGGFELCLGMIKQKIDEFLQQEVNACSPVRGETAIAVHECH